MTNPNVSLSLSDDQDTVSIREATVADLDYLVHMNAAMAWETERRRLNLDRLRAGTKAVLESRCRGLYLLGVVQPTKERDMPVAQLLITEEWSDWRNGVFWWIQSVYVDPRWRGRGIFRRLYHYVEKLAQQQPDVCGLRLYVEQNNAPAQAVYTKLGLARTGYLVFEKDFFLPDESMPMSRHQS